MRTFIILFVLLLIAALGYVGYAQISGGAVPTFGLPIGGEKATIRKLTLAFFEHVKFKNTSAVKDFVAKDKSLDEVATYLSQTFGIDVNQVDLEKVVIDHIELNSNETRARVKINLTGQNLETKKPLDVERIIFLYKSQDGRWLIDIKTMAL